MTVSKGKSVAVIGGGIQGLCVSLALAQRGCKVDLFEENACLISEASLWNEGKIHLGFVFGNDPTSQTAAFLMKGSLRFNELLGRWCGGTLSESEISTPFRYAVHRGSLLSPEQVAAHFSSIQSLIEQYDEDQRRAYFGFSDKRIFRRLDDTETARNFDTGRVAAAFETGERSVDPQAVARRLTQAVMAEAGITVLLGQRVDSCTQDDKGTPSITLAADPGRQHSYDAVVNATWRDRLRLDATFGWKPDRPWLFRYKVALHTQSLCDTDDPRLPSTTFVLGPYGDIVNFGKGRYYLSWYPTGCIASTQALVPSNPLLGLCENDRAKLEIDIIKGLTQLVPACADLDLRAARTKLGGGQIFAWGQGDIDDPQSQLHQRFDIGPRSAGRYHSVDTGKYCMAPLFAEQVAERICPES